MKFKHTLIALAACAGTGLAHSAYFDFSGDFWIRSQSEPVFTSPEGGNNRVRVMATTQFVAKDGWRGPLATAYIGKGLDGIGVNSYSTDWGFDIGVETNRINSHGALEYKPGAWWPSAGVRSETLYFFFEQPVRLDMLALRYWEIVPGTDAATLQVLDDEGRPLRSVRLTGRGQFVEICDVVDLRHERIEGKNFAIVGNGLATSFSVKGIDARAAGEPPLPTPVPTPVPTPTPTPVPTPVPTPTPTPVPSPVPTPPIRK